MPRRRVARDGRRRGQDVDVPRRRVARDGRRRGRDVDIPRTVGPDGSLPAQVAIARALVRDPEILVLDEATSALDAASERVVQKALDDVVRSASRTTLVIAHRLSTIRSASKICVFGKGGLLETGTHDDLIAKKSHYHALVAHQVAASH